MKWGLYALVFVALIGIASSFIFKEKHPQDTRWVGLQKKDIRAEINEKGRVQSADTLWVSAKSAGQIQSIPVKEGQWVNRGQLLIQMNDDIARQKLNELEAQLSAKRWAWSRLKSEIKIEHVLYKAGTISADEWAKTQQNTQAAEAEYRIASAQYQAQKMVCDEGRFVSKKRFQVAAVYVQEGALVAPQENLIQLLDPFHLKVEIRVKESDAIAIKVGQKVRVSPPESEHAYLSAAVTEVQPILEKTSETYGSRVVIMFHVNPNQPHTWLKVGSQVELQIETAKATGVWTLPLATIFFENGGYWVEVRAPKGLQKKRVEVGIQDARDIEIKSGLVPAQAVRLP